MEISNIIKIAMQAFTILFVVSVLVLYLMDRVNVNSPEFLKRIFYRSSIEDVTLKYSLARCNKTQEVVGLVHVSFENKICAYRWSVHSTFTDFHPIHLYGGPHTFLVEGSTHDRRTLNLIKTIKTEEIKTRVYPAHFENPKDRNKRIAEKFGKDVMEEAKVIYPEYFI